MKKQLFPQIFLLGVAILLFSFPAFAQKTEDQAIENYATETALGLNFNTMGGLIGGVNVKIAKRIKPLQYRNLFFELVNIKHPKEDTRIAINGDNFTPGKINYLVLLRTHYGREFTLFRPEAEQGVQVNFLASGGLTTAFEIPYFVEYENSSKNLVLAQYDPANSDMAYNKINRSAGILGEGLSSAKILFGASAKASVAFRFNAFRNTTLGLEGGLMVDVLQRKVVMMETGDDRQIYQTFFITLFYGIMGR